MKQPTPLQQKQLELSWILYRVFGAIVSIKAARDNSVHISEETRGELTLTITALELQECQLRSALSNLKEPT